MEIWRTRLEKGILIFAMVLTVAAVLVARGSITNYLSRQMVEGGAGIAEATRYLNRSVSLVIFLVAAGFIMCMIMLYSLYVKTKKRDQEMKERAVANMRKARSFLAMSGEVTFVYHPGKGILQVSKDMQDYLGYRLPGNWISQIATRSEFHPEFNYGRLLEAYSALLTGAERQEVITALKTEKNGLRWVRIAMMRFKNDEVGGMEIDGTFKDITDEYLDSKLAEEERKYLFSAIFSFVPMAVSADLTDNTYSLINYPGKEGSDLPWNGSYDALHEHLLGHIEESYRKAFETTFKRKNLLSGFAKGRRSVEMEHMAFIDREKPEVQQWFYTKVYMLSDSPDEHVRVLGIVIDITEQKKNTMNLQKRYDLMIEKMPGFVCKWVFKDGDIFLEDANANFYHYMKTSEEKLRWQPVFGALAKEERRQMLEEFYEKAGEEKPIQYSGHAFKADGEECWITISGTFFEREERDPVYYCVISDVTPIVRLNEQTKKNAEELRIAAGLSDTLAIKYTLEEDRITILSEKNVPASLAMMSGHAPEYALENELITSGSGAQFLDGFEDIKNGSPKGNISFVLEKEKIWLKGSYLTVFAADGKPVSAIIDLKDETDDAMETTMRLLAESVGTGHKRLKMVQACLTDDRIEYETDDNELMLSDEGIETYTEALKYVIRARFVKEESGKAAESFFAVDRLKQRYAEGITSDSIVLQCRDNGGWENEVEVKVFLSENQKNHKLKACVMVTEPSREKSVQADSLVDVKDPQAATNRVTIRTFGYFDVFVNGRNVSFNHDKSKEMLAILVHRRGGFVSTSELITYLWEDELSNKTTQARCRQVASRLKKILEEYGIGDIMETVNGRRRIIPEKVDCDLFRCLSGRPEDRRIYNGSYMMNYSWGEEMIADLEFRNNR